MRFSVNYQRRSLVKALLMAPVVAAAYSSLAIAQGREPIQVDVSHVKDIPSLIAAIKKSANGLLPPSMKDEEFYADFAHTFVKNARAAAENGFKIPQWILDRLPMRKVVVPILGVAIFVWYGITFAIPVSTIIVAVLASLAIMMAALKAAIQSVVQGDEKKVEGFWKKQNC